PTCDPGCHSRRRRSRPTAAARQGLPNLRWACPRRLTAGRQPRREGRTMDCNTARRMLEFAGPLHRELDPPDLHALEAHVTACPDCALLSRRERQDDEALGRAVRRTAAAAPRAPAARTSAPRRESGDGSRRRWAPWPPPPS